jgi:lysophospholipase L1-like esterase
MNFLRLIAFAGLSAFSFSSDAIAQETLEQFLAYQEGAVSHGVVNEQTTSAFYKRSFAFWISHAVDYNASPEKYRQVMSIYHQNQEKYRRDRAIKIDRYADTIEQFRRFDKRNALAVNPILFVGSSSIVFWETALSFPDYPVVNRGFGGASLSEIIHYYDAVIKQHAPSIIVVYCDIDVENGKSPEYSVNAFRELVNRVDQDFPATDIIFLSMKPTLIDDVLGKDVRENKIITNRLLAEYSAGDNTLHYVDITKVMFADQGRLKDEIFIDDGMHMNALGYVLWDPIVKAKIDEIVNER